MFDNLNAALAQLVELHFCKVRVLGSSPRGGFKYYLLLVLVAVEVATTSFG